MRNPLAPLSRLAIALSTPFAIAGDAPAPNTKDIAKNYKKLERMTEKPKSIGAQFAGLCRSSDEADAIRKKGGHHAIHFVNYYANDLALKHAAAAAWPAGSVVVKEKLFPGDAGHDPDFTRVEAVAGMIKRPAGTLPKSGDWEFFWLKKGKLTTTGLENCVGCHSGAKRDYVFTTLGKP